MEHTKHIWRAVLLLVVLALSGIGIRHFLIPESFGEMGHFRYESAEEIMAQELVHQSDAACGACHPEQLETKKNGKHASLRCELCHGPLHTTAEVHAQPAEGDAERPGSLAIAHSESVCAYCHVPLEGRPEFVPQIDFREHLTTLEAVPPEEDMPEGVCLVCHDSHSPGF